MSRVILHAGPAFADAEERLLAELAELCAAGRGGAAFVLLPTHRKAAEVGERLRIANGGSVVLPRLETPADLGSWIFDRSADPRARISGGVVRALVGEVLRQAAEAGRWMALGDVRRFPGVAGRVADLLAACKRYGLPGAEALERALTELRGAEGLRPVDRALCGVFARYEERLRDLADPEDVLLTAAGAMEADPARYAPPGVERVVVLGFQDLDRIEERLLEALARAAGRLDIVADHEGEGGATEVADGLRAWAAGLGDTRPSQAPAGEPPGRAGRRAVASRLFSGDAGRLPTLEAVKGLVRIEAVDDLDEVACIAEAILGLEGADLARVAVVLPAMGRYAPLVREVFPRYGVPFDLAHGTPLAETPVGRTAVALLDLVGEGFTRRSLYDVATSPLLRVASEGLALWPGWLDHHAREAGVVGGGGDIEADWLAPLRARRDELRGDPRTEEEAQRLTDQLGVLGRFLRLLEGLGRPAKVDEVAASLRRALEGLGLFRRAGVPGAGAPHGLLREEVAAVEALVQSLRELPLALRSAGLSGPVEPRAIFAALRADWQVREVRVSGDPGGVRVLGRLEPRSLEFDTLFLGGLSSDRFPGRPPVGVILSEADRAELGLPPRERHLLEVRHLLYRALVAPRERLIVSWPARDGETPLAPADLLADLVRSVALPSLPARVATGPVGLRAAALAGLGQALGAPLAPGDAAEVPPPPPGDEGIALAMAAAIEVEALRRGGGPWTRWEGWLEGDAEIRAALAARMAPEDWIFSAAQLDLYALCPFAFLAERVLRLERPEEPGEDDTARVRGELIHRILARWVLDPETAESTRARFARLAEAVMEEEPWRARTGPFWESSKAAVTDLVARIADLEDESDREPLLAEWRFGPDRHGPTLEDPASVDEPLVLPAAGGLGEVRVAGRVDRVDAGEGPLFDYKSGRTPALTETAEGRSLQLPIYLLAARRLLGLPVERATFYKAGRDGAGPVRATWPAKKDDTAEALQTAAERIQRLVDDMRRGRFPVIPWGTKRCPTHCRYARACRVDDGRLAKQEGGA